nr:tyrosine-type recombinase/integrase [Actinopolymorpha alba]
MAADGPQGHAGRGCKSRGARGRRAAWRATGRRGVRGRPAPPSRWTPNGWWPLDEPILDLIDHIVEIRTAGRPLPHPRYRRRAQFLFTHHGKRLSSNAVRAEPRRAAERAGLGQITPHQLRHTYATALVNAGVSLQSLMALLGHVSAEMSLRYGRLFDSTVRNEYEKALTLAKQQSGIPKPARRICR